MAKKKQWSLPAEIHGGKSKPNKAGSPRPDVKPLDVPSHVRNGRSYVEDMPAYPKFSTTADEMQFHFDRFMKMDPRESLWRINNIIVSSIGEDTESNTRIAFGMLWVRIALEKGLRDLTHRGYALLDTGLQNMTPKFKKDGAEMIPHFQHLIAMWKKNAKVPPGFDPYDDESWFKLLPKDPPMEFLATDFLGDEIEGENKVRIRVRGQDARTRALKHLKGGRREFALLLFQVDLKHSREDNDDNLVRDNLLSIIPLLISSYRKEEAEPLINEAIELAEKLGDAEFLAAAKQFQTQI